MTPARRARGPDQPLGVALCPAMKLHRSAGKSLARPKRRPDNSCSTFERARSSCLFPSKLSNLPETTRIVRRGYIRWGEGWDHRLLENARARGRALRDQCQRRLPGPDEDASLPGDRWQEREARGVFAPSDSSRASGGNVRTSPPPLPFSLPDDAAFITSQALSVSGGLTMA